MIILWGGFWGIISLLLSAISSWLPPRLDVPPTSDLCLSTAYQALPSQRKKALRQSSRELQMLDMWSCPLWKLPAVFSLSSMNLTDVDQSFIRQGDNHVYCASLWHLSCSELQIPALLSSETQKLYHISSYGEISIRMGCVCIGNRNKSCFPKVTSVFEIFNILNIFHIG